MKFSDLPGAAQVWVYQANRILTDQEVEEIKHKGDAFAIQWAAHGANLQAAFDVFDNAFLVLAVDQSANKTSGCSLDAATHFIQELEKTYQIELLNRLNIAYRDPEGALKITSMSAFESMIADGTLDENTTVYNNLVKTKAEFMSGWKTPASQSWHARLFA